MRLEVLGCSGAEFPGLRPSAFLLDGRLLLDAGTICSLLPEQRQKELRCILLTHSHLDHVGSLPYLADNLVLMEHDFQVTIGATPATLQALRDNLMNNVVWPDFTSIPLTAPAMRYMEITPEVEFAWEDYSITAFPVNHSVPAVGYCIRKGESCFIYTGDTGPTERIWEEAPVPSTLLIEVSFPNSMEDLARMTGHLTPSLLAKELAKMKALPERILITHLKPQFACRIADDLVELGIPRIELVHEGSVYNI